jgi:hypothetical protein
VRRFQTDVLILRAGGADRFAARTHAVCARVQPGDCLLTA